MKEVAKPLKSCTEAHVEQNQKYVRNLFDTVLSIICGEYFNEEMEHDKCERVMKKKQQKKVKSFQSGTDNGTQSTESGDELKPFFKLVTDILTKE